MQTQDLVVLDLGTSEPSQSDFEAVEKLDGGIDFSTDEIDSMLSDWRTSYDSGILPCCKDGSCKAESYDDVDSMLSAFNGSEGLMSDETVSGLQTSCEADSILSEADSYGRSLSNRPVTAVSQDTDQHTGIDTSCSSSPNVATTSVHSSDTVQSPGTLLQQSTNGTIPLAISGRSVRFVRYTQKQVRLKVSVFLLYPLGSVCLKYSIKPPVLTC